VPEGKLDTNSPQGENGTQGKNDAKGSNDEKLAKSTKNPDADPNGVAKNDLNKKSDGASSSSPQQQGDNNKNGTQQGKSNGGNNSQPSAQEDSPQKKNDSSEKNQSSKQSNADYMDEDKRSARKRLAQQKNEDAGKDDRGINERLQDKQTEQTGVNNLDAMGGAADKALAPVGKAANAAGVDTGGMENAGSELTGAVNRLANTTERQITKFAKFALKVPIAAGAMSIVLPIAMVLGFSALGTAVATTSSTSYAQTADDSCSADTQSNIAVAAATGGDSTAAGDGFSWAQLNDQQKQNATYMAKAVADRNLPNQALVIALSTAMQESGLIVVMHGDAAGPDSIGLFQQRDSWGTQAQRTDPYQSTGLFLDRLVKVPNWQTIPVTVAAQAVQISALPDAYAKHEADARNDSTNIFSNANPFATILAGGSLAAGSGTETATGTDSSCNTSSGLSPVAPGTWLNPYCAKYKMIVSNYFGPRPAVGGTSHTTASFHTGIDMFAGGGGSNPAVCASASGTVISVYSNAACGNTFVIKSDDNIYYGYCHMEKTADLTVGEKVTAGQPIGFEGSTGNSSGQHVHFQISLNPNIFADTANPMCLFKTQPDFVKQMDFTTYAPAKYNDTFDYMCEKRSDLGAWDQTNWN
jgi:murein DD-endopeptidase MepM/ murein hydrolase activator NlpD